MNVILACDEKYGIGLENKIPWSCKEDMKHFKKLHLVKVIMLLLWVKILIYHLEDLLKTDSIL